MALQWFQTHAEVPPFFIVYGDPASFAERLDAFRQALNAGRAGINLEVDVEAAKRDTWPATLLEILAQLGEAVLRTIPASAESTQLQVYKRLHLLQGLQRRVGSDAPDEQLAQGLDFAELVLYPLLAALWQSAPSVTLNLMHVEAVLSWGSDLRNFLLDSLLRHFPHGLVRVGLYVRQAEKPCAFFGSDEMHASQHMRFYCSSIDLISRAAD